MAEEADPFEREIIQNCPANASYYYLVRYNQKKEQVRFPSTQALRIRSPFEHPIDCKPGVPFCGDGVCDPMLEDPLSCAPDCIPGLCGDGLCDPTLENPITCPIDCGGGMSFCGDGVCDPATEDPMSCAPDCVPGLCGDGQCDLALENAMTCPIDCTP